MAHEFGSCEKRHEASRAGGTIFGVSRRTWWILVVPLALVLIAGIAFAVNANKEPELEPVPASVMPAIEGVEVLSSRGFEGTNCCEPYPGGRTVLLDMGRTATPAALDLVTTALRDEGWYERPCQFNKREDCLRMGNYFAYVEPAAKNTRPLATDVEVHFQRAEPIP